MIIKQIYNLTKEEKLRNEAQILPYYQHLIVIFIKPDYSVEMGRRTYYPMIDWLAQTGIRAGYDCAFGEIDFRSKVHGVFGFAQEEHAVAFKVRWVGAEI